MEEPERSTNATTSASTSAAVPTLTQPGLLIMDVDSTLINQEVIDELGEVAGAGDRIAEVTKRAMNGELDFVHALQERVALLKGLPVSAFDEVYEKCTFTPGAHYLIDTLHSHGWKVGVVSGGFHEVVDRLAEDAGLDVWIANRLEVENGALTGRLVGDVVTKDVKLRSLQQWAQEYNIPMSQTVAVGDGANDLPMIGGAALGVAFCAKPCVRDAAPYHIDERNLGKVLELLN